MSSVLVPLAAMAFADDVAPDEPAADGHFALSVGTGPRPLNTLTFGLTGLAARAGFPVGRVVPFASLAVHSVSGANTEDDRATRLGSTHLSAGLRVDLDERRAKGVVPYVLGAALGGRAGARTGSPSDDDWFGSGTFTLAMMAGVGLDGFVTRHLSLGAELGGLGAISNGGGREIADGRVDDEYGEFDTTVLTTFTALQVTVWR